jgi:hypothetical protein
MLKRRLRRCEYQCACPDGPPVAQPPVGRDCGDCVCRALLAGLTMIRIAWSESSLQPLQTDAQRRGLIRLRLHLVPFAGIAFLWFIGVVREQLGNVEDRLFSTVFLGSGLLFLAMLFMGAATSTSLMAMLTGSNPSGDLFAFGRSNAQTLISVYAMRMAAVFTLSVSTVGLRTSGLPRWVSYLGYLVALTLLLAAGEHKWLQLLFPTWVLLVSVVILFTRPHRPE